VEGSEEWISVHFTELIQDIVGTSLNFEKNIELKPALAVGCTIHMSPVADCNILSKPFYKEGE
jgi:hypothetical protein